MRSTKAGALIVPYPGPANAVTVYFMLQCTSTSPLPYFSATTHKKSLLFRVLSESFPSCVGPFPSFIKLHFDYFYRTTTPRPKKILHNKLVTKAMSSASPPSTPLQSTPGSIRSRDLSTSLGSPSFRVSTKQWSFEILALLQPVNHT